MIEDPCNANLIPGIFGDQEGLLAQVKSTLSFNATSTSGYVLWIPSYHCAPDINTDTEGVEFGGVRGNLFVFTHNNTALNPSNDSGSVPFGEGDYNKLGQQMETAATYADPASPLLQSDIVQDARTIGACCKLTYSGQMFRSSGQVCFLNDLPLSSILGGSKSVAGSPTPVDVDDLFRWAGNTTRWGTDTLECVFRPDDSASTFRKNNQAALDIKSPTGYTTESETAAAQMPHAFGFAWRGLDITSGDEFPIILEFTKSIEWRAAPVSGLTHASPMTYHPISQVHRAVQHLDRKKRPGHDWTRRLADVGKSIGGNLANIAFSGMRTLATDQRARNQLLSFTQQAAPLMLTMM